MTRRAHTITRLPKRLEKHEQADAVRLIRSLGGVVYVLGTRRPRGEYQGTCMSPGLPDCIAFIRGHLLMLEMKASGGRMSREQIEFELLCKIAGVEHVVGDVGAVVCWLVAKGILDSKHVSAHRLEAAS